MTELDGTSRKGKNKMRSKCCCHSKWNKLLLEYSQETSFHGPKQMCEPQPFILRRIIWLLLFVGGSVIFLIQMVTSIQYYLIWPVTVDVKINYNDSIVFPAVTICNGNAFRTTEAYRAGFYDIISNLYGMEDMRAFNLSEFDVPDITLDHLYYDFGHNKSDLIFSCEWSEGPCSVEKDFVVTMTDYGMCYTFNSVSNGSQPRMAYQTGAEGGLRLQLNIEQYQYMPGPNEGAGLKIQVHNANEIPLIRDHGLSVPPGHHGLVAIKTIQVNNLPPNHGQCDDSVNLEHFDSYTYSSCFVNCKERHLIKKCGCRDIYMPDRNTNSKVCTICNYTSCVLDALESFIGNKELQVNCTCPIPCKRSLYEPYVSYAATSNFDIDFLLRRNITNELMKEYIKSRETTQRVNKAIVAEDTAIITTLKETIDTLDTAFRDMNQNLEYAHYALMKDFNLIQKRIKYHLDRGLEGVKFIIEHDFIRGWNVFKERSFHYVTMDFIDVPKALKRTIQNAIDNKGDRNITASISDRYLVYSPVLNMLLGRRDSADRAREFMRKANSAYLTGDSLGVPFIYSYERRYDMAYIHLELLQSGKDQMQNYEETVEAIDYMNRGISVLQEVGNQYVQSGYFNNSYFKDGDDVFQKGSRQFNYRIYMFETRVVIIPNEVISERIEKFKINNRSLQLAYDNVQIKIEQLSSLFKDSISNIWQQILDISAHAMEYLINSDIPKTPLSKEVTSKQVEESIRSLDIAFTNVRSRVRELQDELRSLKSAYKNIWISMLSEDSTKAVYKMIYTDCQDFLTNQTSYDGYIAIFRSMLRTKSSLLHKQSKEEIVQQMNGDFFGLNIEILLNQIEESFQNMSSTLDLSRHIGDSDEKFLYSFERFRQSLQKFLSHNVIDSNFYRENFMKLDVFMQELSYEEITQQKAYEITQLLSDIGGSMGLFIGGSVLSIFEFLDIFIHHGVRMALNR